MCDLKKLFLKTQFKRLIKSQFSFENRKLTFKILRFQKNIILPAIWKNRFYVFLNRNF